MVNEEKCIGCAKCEEVCPVGAIKVKDGKATVNEDCIECGACIAECPFHAIHL